MGLLTTSDFCSEYVYPATRNSYSGFVNFSNLHAYPLEGICNVIEDYEENAEAEDGYNSPMVLIGIYISIASSFCILAMALDLCNGFRIRKLWFPTKYFSLNAASITVIAVAMKLPVDLTSPMLGRIDQIGKFGSLAFMCTMMSNLMPSLASMDNKSLLANVTGLSILVITLIVNTFIQIRTHVSSDRKYYPLSVVLVIYMGMLLLLLIILISSAITIPTSKKILGNKYQAISKTIVIDQHQKENSISIIDKLREFVKRYWTMAETGSPQFAIASNTLSSASGIICALSMTMYMLMVWLVVWSVGYDLNDLTCRSVYKQSMIGIVVTQSIGIVVGSIAPVLRSFTVLSFKSFAKQNKNHFLVLKVEKYWMQKLLDWKESRISALSSGHRTRALLHILKNRILWFCIGFQKVVVVSCKIIGLFPIVVILFFVYFSRCFNSAKRMFFSASTASSSVDTNEDLGKYVLLIDDNTQLAKRTMKRISDSMNRLIKKAEKKQHNNLVKLLEQSVEKSGIDTAASNGVVTFDNNQFQYPLLVEHVNSWSLSIISLTCITVVIPDIHEDRVDNLYKSVGEGILYTHLVEESLNTESEYVNIRKTTVTLWHDVEENYKWLETTLKRNAYEGKNSKKSKDIIKLFADSAEKILNEFYRSTNGVRVENEDLPRKVIAANSMYRIANTIIHMYESNNMDIVEEELFTRLSGMIADILAACLTNIPRTIAMRCHEGAIEKREASVAAAIDLLGRTTKIIEKLEKHVPSMDQDKMAYIDEWRMLLRQP